MRCQNLLKWLMIVILAPVSTLTLGADNDPIGKKIDNAKIMERVALIGVIAGGSSKSGVAVIRDTRTGRTYAIKTGDNLPGVGHIRLSGVKRELAVFDVDGKDFEVRLTVGGYAQNADDEEDLDADMVAEPEGPGLFEKWNGLSLGDLDVVRDGDINTRANRREERRSNSAGDNLGHRDGSDQSTNGNKNHSEIVVDLTDQNKTDQANELRKDKDGPANDFLDQMTVGKRRGTKSQNQDGAVGARKTNLGDLKINKGANSSAAE